MVGHPRPWTVVASTWVAGLALFLEKKSRRMVRTPLSSLQQWCAQSDGSALPHGIVPSLWVWVGTGASSLLRFARGGELRAVLRGLGVAVHALAQVAHRRTAVLCCHVHHHGASLVPSCRESSLSLTSFGALARPTLWADERGEGTHEGAALLQYRKGGVPVEISQRAGLGLWERGPFGAAHQARAEHAQLPSAAA